MYVYRFLCIVNRFFFVLEDISLSGYSEIRVEINFMLCYAFMVFLFLEFHVFWPVGEEEK